MDTTRGSGAFAILLTSLTWHSESVPADEANRQVYGFVQLVLPSEQPLEDVWFSAEDENTMTKSVLILAENCGQMLPLDYNQRSRAVPLSNEAMQELVQTQVLLSLYSGTSRVRATDSLLSKTLVPLNTALLEGRSKHNVQLASLVETFEVELDVLCDVALADFMLGARLLQLNSPRILNLPTKWTALECGSNEAALQYCASTEQNTACYELTIAIPRLGETTSRVDSDGELRRTSSLIEFNHMTFKGGKLHFQPAGDGSEPSKRAQMATTDGKRPEEQQAMVISAVSGEWSVKFPSTTMILFLYLKSSIERLIEFLTVEKHVNGTLRRSIGNLTGGSIDAVSSDFCLNLNELLVPGIAQFVLKSPLRTMSPISRELLEHKLASAASNDEKKKVQVALADYEHIVSEAAALTAAATSGGTHVEIVANMLSTPLVLEPPKMLNSPLVSLTQLIPPRDVVDKSKKRRDLNENLRTEIRLAIINLLREYKYLFGINDRKQEMDSCDAGCAASRDDKRQSLIYRLNTQGIYHSLKESLKKQIVPILREAIARNEVLPGESVDPHQVEQDEKNVKEEKTEQLSLLYTHLMHESNVILNETFYSDSDAQLEEAHMVAEGRPSLTEFNSVLEILRMKALENDVNDDFEKSEMLHLDRIAYAEQYATNLEEHFQDQKLADTDITTRFHFLSNAWYDYASSCMSQRKLEKAATALQECLRLDSHFIQALIDLVAVQCELRDFARVEPFVKNAVVKAKSGVPPIFVKGAECSALAHALFAYYFSQSEGKDPTDNLMLFELLKAQQTFQTRGGSGKLNDAACVGAVWVILAKYAYNCKLWGIMQRSLQLADSHLKAYDVLGNDLRVMKRVMEAELFLRENEFTEYLTESRAIKMLQEALEIDSSHPIAWFTLGKIYLRQDVHTATAIECLQRAFKHREVLNLDALRLGLYIRLGLAFLYSSQYEKAEAVFVLACDEFCVASCWLGVGIASLRLEKWDQAQTALAEANRLDFLNPEVWGFMALFALTAHTSVSNCDEINALQFVSQALRHNLSNPALLRELSNAFVAIDRLESAERLLRRSLACQDSSHTRKLLADVLAAQNCAEDALRQYIRLLEVSKDIEERCSLLENCARLFIILGRPEEANEYRNMATKLQTDK